MSSVMMIDDEQSCYIVGCTSVELTDLDLWSDLGKLAASDNQLILCILCQPTAQRFKMDGSALIKPSVPEIVSKFFYVIARFTLY